MEYLDWTNVCELGNGLVKLLIEICHVRFGLRPLDPILEGLVVGGYLNRFLKAGRRHGDLVYILPYEWFQRWKFYTSQEVCVRTSTLVMICTVLPPPPPPHTQEVCVRTTTLVMICTVLPPPPHTHRLDLVKLLQNHRRRPNVRVNGASPRSSLLSPSHPFLPDRTVWSTLPS